ncbi:holin [Planococcus rifietoensis]|uniref:Holin n=1 Tax=Planococcus rifietoensis TaxID=200991 RepID=A0A0U2XMJ6_9BACL|nr:holin [Planococcus rifietoensis]ALS73736.1 holin [Planococcus rifietoensis]
MTDILILTSVLVPVIAGLVEVVKKAVNMKVNFIPVVALLIGLLIGFLAVPISELDTVMRLWAGGHAGLASVGLFEVVKQREGITKEGE